MENISKYLNEIDGKCNYHIQTHHFNVSELTNENFNKILCKLHDLKQYINSNDYDTVINSIITNKNLIHINDNALITICSDNADLYTKIVNFKKTKPIIKHLILTCEKISSEIICDDKLIQKILEQNILPTHKCFEILTSKSIEPNNNLIPNIINLLIKFGLVLTLDDIKSLAKDYVDIDTKPLNIIPDSDLVNICMGNAFFPQYLDKANITDEQFHNLFKANPNSFDFTDLDDFTKTHKLKYDVECLQLACKIHGNNDMIDFLVNEKNVIPDITCVENIIKTDSIDGTNDNLKTIAVALALNNINKS